MVRLRGLPYSATSREILDLLHDCCVSGGDKGVRFSFAPDGRPSGEAFVELASEEDVSKALGHNKEHLGRRYVEIFRATKGQLEWEGRLADKVGGGTGGVVRLRGLPFKCTEDDIRQFFQGLGKASGLGYTTYRYTLVSVSTLSIYLSCGVIQHCIYTISTTIVSLQYLSIFCKPVVIHRSKFDQSEIHCTYTTWI